MITFKVVYFMVKLQERPWIVPPVLDHMRCCIVVVAWLCVSSTR